MPWMRLEFQPGIVKNRTSYGTPGYWTDGSLIRFRGGLPEAWGGWVRTFEDLTLSGICRSMNRWTDLVGFTWVGFGTHLRFYVASDDINYEVTPIEESATLGTDPIDTVSASTNITINHTSHGRVVGSYVIISGATAVGGVPDTEINAEHEIIEVTSDDAYVVSVTTAASSSVSGGGSSVDVDYLYLPGGTGQTEGGGYGTLGWGDEEYGGDAAIAVSDRLGTWTQGNWGEDMVACPAGGPIFYWDATNPDQRMVDILDLASADGNAPAYSEFIIVSHRDRHLLAFGASEFSTGNAAPMAFRWCDQEDILNWDEASTTSTAGSLPLSSGSRLIAGIATAREIVVWSDTTMYSIQFIGAPFVFSADVIENSSDIVGLHAATQYNSVVYWMGRSGFYAYTNRAQEVPCPIWDYISMRLDFTQVQKVVASTNRLFSEVIWFYPSIDGGGEIDSYAAFNAEEGVWTHGSLARTAWLDGDSYNNPIAVTFDGEIYSHENGGEDGSVSPAVAINSYIESSPIELSSEGAFDKGDRFMFLRRILPDVTFRSFDDGVNTPGMNIVLKMMDKPGGGFTNETSSSQVSRSAIVPVEEFTTEAHIRLRGRAMVLRAETANAGSLWRLGVPRIDVRTDGQR